MPLTTSLRGSGPGQPPPGGQERRLEDLLEATESFELAGECEGALMPECGIISCPLRMVPRV